MPSRRPHACVLLPLFAILASLAPAGSTPTAPMALQDAEPETIQLRDGLALERMGTGGRQPFFADPVALAIVRDEWRAPAPGDTFPLADGGAAAWTQIQAGDDGWIRGRQTAGGYVSFTVERDEPVVMILEAQGHSVVYVNGEPRTGDPYSNGLIRLPVELRAGKNELLFKGGRGQLRAQLVAPAAPLSFDTVDDTLPDQIVGEDGEMWAGISVLNATTEGLEGVTIVATAADGSRATTEGIRLAPLSVHKAATRLPRGTPDAEGRVAIRLEVVHGGQTAHQREVVIQSRGPSERHVRTFVSDIDGSVQYYAVTPQAPPAEGETRAERPALFLSLHGASVEARGQAAAYAPKGWGVVVAPTNRRPFGFDWEDWGRLDAMEVLGVASRLYDADPDRTYLTGHSMGGHGTWQLGAQFADRFAAIGPSAGWISFWSYGGLIDYGDETPVREAFTRAASPSDTLALSDNYASTAAYILHGDADDNVPVEQARQMRARLSEFHPNFAYYEQPGAGHWWGDQCVDWAPMFEFFAANRRPASVDRVRFVTASPGVSADVRWASVLEQAEPMRPSRIDLALDAGAGKLGGTTENVVRLALRLDEARRPIKRKLDSGEEIEVEAPVPGEAFTVNLDGETLSLTPRTFDEPLFLTRLDGAWKLDSGPRPERRGPGRSGPFKHAFTNRAVLVYATGGDAEENAWALAKARFDAETFKYRGNGAFEVVSDAQFLAAPAGSELADVDRNVVVYGNASTNKAWGRVVRGGALTLTREQAAIGREAHSGPELAMLAVRPRVGSDSALVGIVGGTGLAGCRATDRLPYFVSGVAYPDYTILTPDVYRDGIDAVVEAGFFRGDWSATGETGDPAPAAASGALARVERIEGRPGGAEILAYDHVHRRLYATHARGVDIYDFSVEGRLTPFGTIEGAAYVPGLASASSVAIDPAGRGFGALTLIPNDKDTFPGVLALFETETGRVLATFAAGFNPDMVCFSPDGGRILVANEGEPGASDPAGSMSILDLGGVRRPADAARLGVDRVTTIDFTAPHLAEGVGFAGLRIAPALRDRPWLDLEPEFIAPDLEGAWVSLQENNGLARFDFATGRWTALLPLGERRHAIDASDKDGGVLIDDTIVALPMPDTICGYSVGGRRYLITANEGDAREGDEARFAESRIDPVTLATLLTLYRDPRDEASLGRLKISTTDGDTDGDGDIDVPTVLGARSFSILDAETGARVFDSGSSLEFLTGALAPELFNSDGDAATFDTRSDDRGPEPEGIAVARLGDRQVAFLGLERAGGIAMFDVTDPRAPRLLDYARPDDSAGRGVGPEGLAVIKSGEQMFLAVAYEVSGTIEIFQIDQASISALP